MSRSCAEEMSSPPAADINTTATNSPTWRVNRESIRSRSVSAVRTRIPACAAPADPTFASSELWVSAMPKPDTPFESDQP